MSRIALVRRPGPRLADGIVTHIERTPVDVDLAHQQWDRYCQAMESNGWDLPPAPAADDCPDAVFIEDTVVMWRNVAVITNPGADTRKAEVTDVAKALEMLNVPMVRIHPPGTLDGGDVLKIAQRIYVGRGGRTNAEGVAQLRDLLRPLGGTVMAVPLTKVLHLKSAVTALPDGTIIGFEPLVDDPAYFIHFVPVPEESGAHVIDLGNGKVLMAADAPHSAAMFASLGFEPVTVDISEFQKLEGCVTCLSVRLRHLDT